MVLNYVLPGLLTQQIVKAILVINSVFYHNKFGVLSLKNSLIFVFLLLFCYQELTLFIIVLLSKIKKWLSVKCNNIVIFHFSIIKRIIIHR